MVGLRDDPSISIGADGVMRREANGPIPATSDPIADGLARLRMRACGCRPGTVMTMRRTTQRAS
jgi:hypothetical protein